MEDGALEEGKETPDVAALVIKPKRKPMQRTLSPKEAGF